MEDSYGQIWFNLIGYPGDGNDPIGKVVDPSLHPEFVKRAAMNIVVIAQALAAIDDRFIDDRDRDAIASSRRMARAAYDFSYEGEKQTKGWVYQHE